MNLSSLKQVYRSPDLRRRVLVVLGLLVIFRFLAHIPVPVPDNAALSNFLKYIFNSNNILGFADIFSGGALSNFSIIMMGVGPYINASIIMQLLQQVVPSFQALSKEGEQGRKKLNQYTRLLTLPLAIVQSFGMVFLIQQTSIRVANTDVIGHPNPFQWLLMVSTITAGTMLLMWIGEIITEKGIGNGISLIIFCGIVSALPGTAGQLGSLATGDAGKIVTLIGFVAATLAIIAFVVILNEGQRNIPVSYAKRTRGQGLRRRGYSLTAACYRCRRDSDYLCPGLPFHPGSPWPTTHKCQNALGRTICLPSHHLVLAERRRLRHFLLCPRCSIHVLLYFGGLQPQGYC